MEENKQNVVIEDEEVYENRSHKYGRIYMALALLVMLGVPTIICIVVGTMPVWSAVATAVISLSILNLPGAFVEMGTYAPLIGTDATYLAFVTGNLINLKVPCAANAQRICKTQIGTEENNIVSTLAVGTSTLMNCLVMTLGVILLAFLMPIMESEVLQPAFQWVVPALFGALAWPYFKDCPIMAIIMVVFVTVISLLLPSFANGVTIFIVVCVAISIGISFGLYKLKKI